MKYLSTRGGGTSCSSAEAIKRGLAEDGGLYFPDSVPQLTDNEFEELCASDYPTRAAKIMYKFLNDSFSYNELYEECAQAYREESFPDSPTQVVKLNDKLEILELWHGPTAAFKDMALQIMPRLFVRAVNKTGDKRTAHILVATSGDTGKAALEGYKNVDGVKISVFYPVNGVSKVQKLQMATQEGNNVKVYSVIGNFDDAQNGVKKIFGDTDMRDKLDKNEVFLSSANSINWGRLVPQVVYYISAYCDMFGRGDIVKGEKINICVPTGNFGNILAAYIAKMMGLPVNKLVCASNSNNVLTDFFETGTYDRNRKFHTTVSPSMDILISSNLERLLYLMEGAEATNAYMKSLSETGRYTVSEDVKKKLDTIFAAGFCSEENTAKEIRKIYNGNNYLSDTHTAVGLYCAEKYISEIDPEHIMLVASTASPYKFSPAVLKAISGEMPENELDAIDILESKTGVAVPAPLSNIAKRKIRFDPDKAIKAEDMPSVVLNG